jgi:hypothetical protein
VIPPPLLLLLLWGPWEGLHTPALRAQAGELRTAGAGPVIRGEGTNGCPSAQDVSARLAGLLAATADAGPPEVLEMAPERGGLRLRLWRADGTLVAERDIAPAATCAEMAEAAAVLAAAWEADLRPATTRLVAGPPSAMSAPVPDPFPAVPSPSGTALYELGAVPAVWLGGGGPAVGGLVRGGLWSRRAPLGITAALAAAFPATAQGGLARWHRYALSGGVVGRMRRGLVFVDALAETVLAWLVPRNDSAGETSAAFDPGLSLALRAGRPVSPRLEVAASLGVWGAALRPGGADGRVAPGSVPRWGVVVGIGASMRFGE